MCTTLVINIFSPHASKLSLPLIKVFLRIFDRNCSIRRRNIKFDENEHENDVKTKKLLQADLNKLYTGD